MGNMWNEIQDGAGICGGRDPIETDTETGDDMAAETRNAYHWTPACQRLFLEALACTGSIMKSAKEAGKSPRAAYNLRFRREGAAFRLGWDAAILISREVVSSTLMDRALHGYEETTMKLDDGGTLRGKYDNKLSMGLLSRLDRMAQVQAAEHSREAQVQLVVQDFEAFLDLIEKGGSGAAAALFCAARDAGQENEPDIDEEQAIERELSQITGDAENVPDLLDEAPDVAAARLSVWYDDHQCEWRTNFPPPENAEFDELDFLDDGGMIFGDPDYERPLTPDEADAHRTAITRQRQPWQDAAAIARDQWFGFKQAA